MKIALIALLCVAAFAAVSAEFVLVFEDNFDGGNLNDRWAIDNGCSGNGNDELQCYTGNRNENIRQEGGNLVLQARREWWGDGGATGGDKPFTSGKLHTKASWTHGFFEIRARLPKGKHLWPAFWMMPQNSDYGGWPRSGEIDIMEYRGQRPTNVLGTVHFGDAWNNKGDAGTGERTFNSDFSQGFHVFGFDWNQDRIQWLVDGNVYHEETLQRNFWPGVYNQNGSPFDRPFFIILNLAVGGNFFGGEGFDPIEADGWAKNTFEIDYVRKWEWH